MRKPLRYDQPVLIRLNTKDEIELREGFPKTAEGLYGYEGIILDDFQKLSFLPLNKCSSCKNTFQNVVAAFLCLAVQIHCRMAIARTPIGDMLPLYLDRQPNIQLNTEFKMDLTPEGWLQPWYGFAQTIRGKGATCGSSGFPGLKSA